VLACSAVRAEPILYTIENYDGREDAPFQAKYFEDFEDGVFDIPGLTVGGGLNLVYPPRVYAPSGNASGVESDGKSYGPYAETIALSSPSQHRSVLHFYFEDFVSLEERLSFAFALTTIPTDATFTVDVYGKDETLLKRFRPPIASFDEPVLFAIASDQPFYSVEIWSYTIGHPSFFRIDHLQYGIPEPSASHLALFGMIGTYVLCRTRCFQKAECRRKSHNSAQVDDPLDRIPSGNPNLARRFDPPEGDAQSHPGSAWTARGTRLSVEPRQIPLLSRPVGSYNSVVARCRKPIFGRSVRPCPSS
jgi:hypothetical protein